MSTIRHVKDSQLDKDFSKYIGHYLVEPGQYQHLDGQHVELTNNQLRIVIDNTATGNHIFLYSVSRIRFLQNPQTLDRATAIALTVTNANRIHSQDNPLINHQVEQLLDDILGVKAPTMLYLAYDRQSNYYTLKNSNYATIAVLQRIDTDDDSDN